MKTVLRKAWPSVRRVTNHGQNRFLVDSRRTGFPGRREYFDTEADALATAEAIERKALVGGVTSFLELSSSQSRDAGQALELLARFDPKLLDRSSILLDAARCYVDHLQTQAARAHVPTVAEVLERYLAAKAEEEDNGQLAAHTLKELRSRLKRVRLEFGRRKISELDTATIEAFLRRLPVQPRTRLNVKTKFSQLLNFARRQKWIAINPIEDLEVRVKNREVTTLSVERVSALLNAAQSVPEPGSVLPYLAVSLFAGLRPGEAEQLRWEFVHFDTGQLEVRAATSKTRETRYVPLEPMLQQWLFPYRQASGPVIGRNFYNDLRAVKTLAGFGIAEGQEQWGPNILRHCYGSMWLAIHQDRAKLAELMGNTLVVIKRHYRRAIPEPIARAFWTLRPSSKRVIVEASTAFSAK